MPNSSESLAQAKSEPTTPQPGLTTGPTHVASRSTQTRASNVARARLVVSKVTPTGYSVGLFMANHARYAKPSDIRRNVVPGEIFCYWTQAKVAAAMGCSERQVQRGVRSLREAGAIDVRRRVRPCEASYVWVLPVGSGVGSSVGSGVGSHTEPRKEPQNNHVGSSRAREVCKICGHTWPAEHGTTCFQCPQPTASQRRDQERERRNQEAGDELERQIRKTMEEETPKVCTCGDAYRNSYGRRCVDCEGTPSAAQSDAAREKHGGGCRRWGGCRWGGCRWGGSDHDSETDARAAAADPPPHADPGPNQKQFYQDLSKWRVQGGDA